MKHSLASLPLMEAYEIIEDQSRALLEAAEAGQWEAFDYLQAQTRALVEDIRCNPAPRALAPDEARRRREILSHILDDDRQIRDIIEPRSRCLDDLVRLRAAPGTGAD